MHALIARDWFRLSFQGLTDLQGHKLRLLLLLLLHTAQTKSERERENMGGSLSEAEQGHRQQEEEEEEEEGIHVSHWAERKYSTITVDRDEWKPKSLFIHGNSFILFPFLFLPLTFCKKLIFCVRYWKIILPLLFWWFGGGLLSFLPFLLFLQSCCYRGYMLAVVVGEDTHTHTNCGTHCV